MTHPDGARCAMMFGVPSMGGSPRQGPGRPAGVDSLDTRQRVIDAACLCFARYGYGPSTNNLIADAAGVTAGSVYYHFRSKKALFEAVCDHVYGQLIARVNQVTPDEYEKTTESHARGAILVAAVFDAFLLIYERRTADLLRLATGGSGILQPGAIHPDLVNRLAGEASKAAADTKKQIGRAHV